MKKQDRRQSQVDDIVQCRIACELGPKQHQIQGEESSLFGAAPEKNPIAEYRGNQIIPISIKWLTVQLVRDR